MKYVSAFVVSLYIVTLFGCSAYKQEVVNVSYNESVVCQKGVKYIHLVDSDNVEFHQEGGGVLHVSKETIHDHLKNKYGGTWVYERVYYGHRWNGDRFSVEAYNKKFPGNDNVNFRIYFRTDITEGVYLYDDIFSC